MGLFDKAKQAKQSAADAMAQAGAMQQQRAGRLRHRRHARHGWPGHGCARGVLGQGQQARRSPGSRRPV